ncbi:helix-turn-helix domain-containing protein [Chryseobacterium oryzae]|uniref:Helix-turn-helix domain-containing protein n=1 Tax=Chryseobacterium oryzae TaxID=2929799 RepID=A0ABY4BRS8_9FLAO|nr:helix-turn-helix transcriptional regulator [Chryseobacterium oryzae]UOE39265.1 helix-turn-helix domain-containing protein [Chryseobacterium oryzae]
MSLNERISKIIEYSGYTPSEFADEIDVQRSSISHVTSGRNKPSLEFIIKIKSRFPEILWDWLVNGEGEMLKSELKEEQNDETEKTKPTSLPDLFTLISEDEILENVDLPKTEENITQSESPISYQSKEEQKILNSQPLENSTKKVITENTDNQTNKIKRIVLFYENGKFESFEP